MGAFVDVHLHVQQFFEDLEMANVDGVMERTPTALPQFVNDEGLGPLEFNELLFLDIFGKILEDVKEEIIIFAGDGFE